jgi:UDP-glucose 4-epimerase
MKVLVTGGAGFLGSHVLEELIDRGHNAVCFDLQPSSFCGSVVGDLLSMDDLVSATKDVDAVCHLGAIGDVYLAFEKPHLAAAVNATGTANLMEACLANGVSKVVYASTWEVYGPPKYEPLDEAHPCNPDHPYNVTKLAGEQIAMAYDRLKGVPVIALRLGTSFGTRMRGNSVFSIFIKKALAHDPITIQGTGEQARQFVHARDAAKAFAIAMESSVRAESFNIAPSRSVSIKELAEMIARRIPTDVTFAPARAGDIHPAKVSAEKASSVLGWKPIVNFEDGLAEIIREKMDELYPATEEAEETVHA